MNLEDLIHAIENELGMFSANSFMTTEEGLQATARIRIILMEANVTLSLVRSFCKALNNYCGTHQSRGEKLATAGFLSLVYQGLEEFNEYAWRDP